MGAGMSQPSMPPGQPAGQSVMVSVTLHGQTSNKVGFRVQ